MKIGITFHSYYKYLAPLTPISPPDFRSPATHLNFLTEEPMLAVTILTIASRYKQLSGPGGKSRSYMIHERLWSYLQNMITRMFWGQEQFGGGFCGAGSQKQRTNPTGGLRTLGTIESLLLLSDFHPRSMHFPPGDDGDDILVPAEVHPVMTQGSRSHDMPSFGESTVAGWSEPALRSDRMCWSLIGMSHTLAYELGIFGNYHTAISKTPASAEEHANLTLLSPSEQRARRVERLLYVYINSACGRFGFPTMYAGQDKELEPRALEQRINTGSWTSQDPVETIQRCWTEVTSIMKACNFNLFVSKEKTQGLIQSGGYVAILQQLQPLMDSWQTKLEGLNMPTHPRIILMIEVEYVRVYIYSLALQAVLEHWTTNAGASSEPQRTQMSLSGIYRRNEYYIKEVVKAARNLLRLVVEGLLPDNYLRHAPVRTHFRILSGAMFLLKVWYLIESFYAYACPLTLEKTFALGAKEDDVHVSLQLLDSTVQALRTSVVDDVHLCLRIADLLEGLTSSIRHKFVRLAARTSKSNTTTPPNTAINSQGRGDVNTTANHLTPATPSYKPFPTDRQSPLAGIPANPINLQDSSIAIMPPPTNTYQFNQSMYGNNSNATNNTYGSPSNSYSGLSPFNANEEDWLTLDLNPLLSTDSAGFQTGNGGTESQWFGNFGPEINGNLEVLGKLVEGWDMNAMGAFQ